MAMLLLRRFSGSLKKAFKASEARLRAAVVPLAFYTNIKFDIIHSRDFSISTMFEIKGSINFPSSLAYQNNILEIF
jgi:hypothetical protein